MSCAASWRDFGGQVYNPRPNIIDPSQAVLSSPADVAGGKQLLNPAAFQTVTNALGNEAYSQNTHAVRP
jgi:hypothetical protein